MDHVLAEKLDVFATVYLDDILVFSKNEHNHAEHLCWVLTKLCEHKLKANTKRVNLVLQNCSILATL